MIICLCGSLRYLEVFKNVTLQETLKGNIVLVTGSDFVKSKDDYFTEKEKLKFREVHFKKLEMADLVYILNVSGYMGFETITELAQACLLRKPIKFFESYIDKNTYKLWVEINKQFQQKNNNCQLISNNPFEFKQMEENYKICNKHEININL